jgi:AAA15 family ATPase/GTPase
MSPVTMLTGTNGVGKTSVLEGLYCLLSETRLDVFPLSRYDKSFGIKLNHGADIPGRFLGRQFYNYKLFWEECPSHQQSECAIEAKTEDGLSWSWKYKKANLSDIEDELIKNAPILLDSSIEFALWNWRIQGNILDKITQKNSYIDEKFTRAQILYSDGRLVFLPFLAKVDSFCQYFNFAAMSLQLTKLSFETSKYLTKGLQIINKHITDVRLTDIESELSVILDDQNSVSLASLGNGALTWAKTLIAILNFNDIIKQPKQTNKPFLLLFDEIGVGLHYSVMLDVWNYLIEFAKENPHIQFVFTSHSDDCIRAYCNVFSNSDQAKIIRLHQIGVDNEIATTYYMKDSFKNIIKGDWEIRG